jgi:hypothetical protein
MFVSMFQLSKELTDFQEILYERFAIRSHPKAAIRISYNLRNFT